jgi:putative ABC transport system permease protein
MKPFRKFRALFRKGKLEREMAEEMRFHLEQRAADYAADGLPDADARDAAHRRFGNVASIQEHARAARGWDWLEQLFQDTRFALRQLTKSPGFTLTAIVTLGLGIGANTSMFTVINGLVLRPLPYADADHIDRLYRATAQNPRGGFSPADYLDLKSAMSGYGEVAAYGEAPLSIAEPGQPAEMPPGFRASANLFSVLGVQPELGRNFRPDEDRAGNHRVLIISHRYWQIHFASDPHIVGRTVRLNGESHEIIGVLPASFDDWRHLGWVDLFRPLGFSEKESSDRNSVSLRIVGHRSTALTPAEANSFIARFGLRLAKDFPAANADTTWRTLPIHETVVSSNGPATLAMLLGLSGFVLLIACSNLANFLLARTMARAREFAVRAALGASRSRLLRPLLLESLLLAIAGGIGAIFVAQWTCHWLAVLSTDDDGYSARFAVDWHVFGWAFAACVVTALTFGFAPALFALRLDINRTLKSSARNTTGDRGHQRFRRFLIIGQFALAMVLLAGAALFVHGLQEMNHRRSGWETEHLLTANLLLPTATYPGSKEITDFQRLALERLEALPGVTSASVSYSMPFFDVAEARKFLVAGRKTPEPGREPAAVINGVSPHYFETVGTRLLSGRTFNAGDTLTSPKVFIINQAMANALFGHESPLGRRIAQAGGKTTEWGEIVGVVADVQSVDAEPNPITSQLYQPMEQEARPYNEIAVHTAGVAPATLIADIRTTMTALNADLPVRRLQPAETTIARANYQLGVLCSMLSALGLLGLGLASLGIYGVIARTMAQRATEFGIRFALGAQVEDITRLVLASGLKLALIGSVVGLVGAFGVTRLIASSYPNMHPNSPLVLGGVTLLLATVALVACYLPARRAGKVDPISALRAE